MLTTVLSPLFWLGIALSSIVLFPVALLIWLVTAPFDRRLRLLHRFTCFWASLYSWLNPAWRVHVLGRENVRPGATYVMVANHLSFLDILVLFRLQRHFKWVSKVEMFRIPVIGWNMRLNRYVALRRGDKDSIREMMDACRRTLAEGSSLMIFPEGTRSPDGRLRAFKPGAFRLALDARVPILPIVISGTADALPKHGIVLRGRHQIGIRVLPELPYESFADLTVEELGERVHELFLRETGAAASTPTDTERARLRA
ncbi:MAG: lysophospholipid acyltransferase family protein [Thermodesulfobacteriota bacterium]